MPKEFPKMLWDADGNVHLCNGPADVDPSWTNYHPNDVEKAAAKAEKAAVVSAVMSRDDIVAALNQGGVEFKKNAPTPALYKQLVAALRSELDQRGVQYPADADAPALLALVAPPEAAPQE